MVAPVVVALAAQAVIRAAQNTNAIAQSALARWTQNTQNSRRLKAGGQALEANTVNTYRQLDAKEYKDFSGQIAQSEQAGMSAVSAAAAGIGGGVVDMVNASTALRNSIVDHQSEQQGLRFISDSQRRAGNIMSQTIGGLDSSIIFDSLDYNVDYAKKMAVPGTFASIFQGVLGAVSPGSLSALKGQDSTTGSTDFKPYELTSSFKPYDQSSGSFQFKMPESTDFTLDSAGAWTSPSNNSELDFSSLYSR
jgi:hypothetical protein